MRVVAALQVVSEPELRRQFEDVDLKRKERAERKRKARRITKEGENISRKYYGIFAN